MDITKEKFGNAETRQNVDVYTLTNKNGMKVKFLNYGGIITQFWAPDRNGLFQDIVLGYGNMQGILADTFYMLLYSQPSVRRLTVRPIRSNLCCLSPFH